MLRFRPKTISSSSLICLEVQTANNKNRFSRKKKYSSRSIPQFPNRLRRHSATKDRRKIFDGFRLSTSFISSRIFGLNGTARAQKMKKKGKPKEERACV